MAVVTIINRAGSKGLIGLCTHGIVHLNLDRNSEILREGRFIHQMCKDVRMVIMSVQSPYRLVSWPARDREQCEEHNVTYPSTKIVPSQL